MPGERAARVAKVRAARVAEAKAPKKSIWGVREVPVRCGWRQRTDP